MKVDYNFQYGSGKHYRKIDVLSSDEFVAKTSKADLELLKSGKQFYQLNFSNVGGLVMPLILEITYQDDTKEVVRIPAEIWRQYEDRVSKVLILDKEVKQFRLDPFLETADTDLDNNSWPKVVQPTRYELFQQKRTNENPMQRQKRVDEIQKQ